MTGQSGRIIGVGEQQLVGLHRYPVPRDGKCGIMPASRCDIVIIPRLLDVAGVIQIHDSILDQRGAGIYAVDVPRLIRIEHDRQLFPLQQIAAPVMPPVLDTARRVKRAVLVKYMIPFPAPAQAVRVIEPAHRRHQMEPLAVGVRRSARSVFAFDPLDQTRQVPV